MSSPDRLDAIYECFEDGNHKAAIKLCLKPDIAAWPITRALLAYSYSCLRQQKEAMEIARSVMATIPTDEGVLNTLAYTFKACKADKDLSQCYENALKVQPNHTPFLMELFFCHIRMAEPKKMQLLAQKLYKATSNKMFVFWSVSSMLQQDDLPLAMLTVAERMLQKVFVDIIHVGAEELEIYIELLLKQGKTKEALAQFEDLSVREPRQNIEDEGSFSADPSQVKMHSLQRHILHIRLLEVLLAEAIASEAELSSGRKEIENGLLSSANYTSRIVAELYEVLAAYPDQWDAHKQLIGYIIPQITSQALDQVPQTTAMTAHSNQMTAAVIEHRSYLLQLQMKMPCLRGPYLAEMLLLVAWVKGTAINEPSKISVSESF
jgi:tetratricopeptide (TPR) repeat protein